MGYDINVNVSFVLKALLDGLTGPVTKSVITFSDITATSSIKRKQSGST